MVFKSDKQRKGFFARVGEMKEQHRINVEKKLDASIDKERRELKVLQSRTQKQQEIETIRLAKNQQIVNQKTQIADLKKAKKEAKAEAFRLTTRGKALALLRKEGASAKRFATSKDTKRVLKKIGKALSK